MDSGCFPLGWQPCTLEVREREHKICYPTWTQIHGAGCPCIQVGCNWINSPVCTRTIGLRCRLVYLSNKKGITIQLKESVESVDSVKIWRNFLQNLQSSFSWIIERALGTVSLMIQGIVSWIETTSPQRSSRPLCRADEGRWPWANTSCLTKLRGVALRQHT